MSSLPINSMDTKLFMNIDSAITEAKESGHKMATGNNYANPGEKVAERSIGSSLKSVASALNIAKNNLEQACNVVDAGYALNDSVLNVLLRQKELCIQASSDVVSDKERVPANIEFQQGKQQIDDISKFKYNDIPLVDGTFAGQSKIQTMQPNKISIYKLDGINQFSSYGNISENALIVNNSKIEATDVMGKDYASGVVDLSGIFAGGEGSTVTINGQRFTAVQKPEYLIQNNEFNLMKDDAETVKNLVFMLNTSEFNSVNQASYIANGSTIEIKHNQAGFMGNDFSVDLKIIGGENNGYYTLHGGTDKRDHASIIIEFDATSNYAENDSILLNDEKFIFKQESDVVIGNHVALGDNIEETMHNLINAVRTTNSKANEAFLEYDNTDNKLIITHRQAGVIGNSYNLNVGGGSAIYTFANSGIENGSNDSKLVTIAKVVDGRSLGLNEVALSGSKVSLDESTFDQGMVGDFGNLRAEFKAGHVTKDGFVSNKVQFQISLNGEIYQTNDIILSGANRNGENINGNGFNGLGNKIAGESELLFQKIGARETDAGFKIKVAQEGIILKSIESASQVQEELNGIINDANFAIQVANSRLGITSPSVKLDDFSLNSIDRFSVSGFLAEGSRLSGGIEITDKVGINSATGTVKFLYNASDNDQLIVNGVRIILGDDIEIGADAAETRNKLVDYLNKSTDRRISQAFYVSGTDNDIIVHHKEKGSSGNDFTIGAKFEKGRGVLLNGSYCDNGILKQVTLGESGNHLDNKGFYSQIVNRLEGGFFKETVLKINYDGNEIASLKSNVDVDNAIDAAQYWVTLLSESGDVSIEQNVSNIDGLTYEDIAQYVKFSVDENDANLLIISSSLIGSEGDKLSVEFIDGNVDHFIATDVLRNNWIEYSGGEVNAQGGEDASNSANMNVNLGKDYNLEVLQYTQGLQGKISDVKATFHEGSISSKAGGIFTPNYVSFSAMIGSNVYQGDVYLTGGSVDQANDANGTNYNKLGHLITQDNKIILNSNDNTHSIVLTTGSDGINLDGLTSSEINYKLSLVASDIQRELSNFVINQKRNIANFDESKTNGTVLHGLKSENVFIQAPKFENNGDLGSISPFKVDHKADTISVNIDGNLYSQVLLNSESEGGLGSSYDSTNKIIKGGLGTTIELVTRDIVDDTRMLSINLQGVTDIDISTESGAKALEKALNDAFGVSGSGEGLSYQVGASPDEIIILKFASLGTDAIYRDESGNARTDIDINTKENAQEALRIVDKAISYISEQLASIGSSRSHFSNKKASLYIIQSSMESSANALTTADVYEASSAQARAALKAQAAISALVHSNNLSRTIVNSVLNG